MLQNHDPNHNQQSSNCLAAFLNAITFSSLASNAGVIIGLMLAPIRSSSLMQRLRLVNFVFGWMLISLNLLIIVAMSFLNQVDRPIIANSIITFH